MASSEDSRQNKRFESFVLQCLLSLRIKSGTSVSVYVYICETESPSVRRDDYISSLCAVPNLASVLCNCTSTTTDERACESIPMSPQLEAVTRRLALLRLERHNNR